MTSSKASSKTILDLTEAYDEEHKKRYKKGKFLGKGGFAHCYELIDCDTKAIYAGKIVPKSMLTKPHQKDKMTMEIDIHRSLGHSHVVGFHGFFEDKNHVYILLELCRRRSLMELHKRRKRLTEPEVRYFLKQTLLAVKYLHDNKVIHRDLKLGNLFINDNMDIKVGDFGLATRVEIDGERKRTLCGTPNYIAPEVLGKKGHSYEVDIWSIGCILYTLLVGKPPFETESLKDTYQKIKRNEYRIPSDVSAEARALITSLLHSNPSCRPGPQAILNDPFMAGFIPVKLPVSALTTTPHFKTQELVSRQPLSQVNIIASRNAEVGLSVKPSTSHMHTVPKENGSDDFYLHSLLSQIQVCVDSSPADGASKPEFFNEAEDPASMPVFWVSKWVDYSDKYGLGYQLCDTSVGVLYNDFTRMLLGADGVSLQYINRDSTEEFYTIDSHPDPLTKKVTLLKYFKSYMSEHLLKAGGTAGERPIEDGVRLPHLRAWFRTRSAIVLHLSNGILQINFFEDHTKIIICPLMSAVTYIDEAKSFRTYRLDRISKYGCGRDLASRLRYAKTMCERLIGKLDSKSVATAKSEVNPMAIGQAATAAT